MHIILALLKFRSNVTIASSSSLIFRSSIFSLHPFVTLGFNLLIAQNVKSIVWPPSNPPEDEPPKYEPANTTYQEDNSRSLNAAHNVLTADVGSQVAKIKEQAMTKIFTGSQPRQEFSNQSYSSAAISSTSATKSEFVFQNTQCQVVQESSNRTEKSFSQQSAKSESVAYEYRDNSSQSFENSEININTDKLKPNISYKEIDLKNSQNTPQTKNMKAEYNEENETRNLNKQKLSIINSDNQNMILNQTKQFQSQYSEYSQTKVKDKNGEANNTTEDIANYETVHDNKVKHNIPSTNPQSANKLDSNDQSLNVTLIKPLTIAQERPYSPLLTPTQPDNLLLIQTFPEDTQTKPVNQLPSTQETSDVEQCALEPQELSAESLPIFSHPSNRAITPIPLVKSFEPPENTEPSISMPPKTKQKIVPEFKTAIEPKQPHDTTRAPLIEALTTAPDRSYAPTFVNKGSIERGSLRDALTIAPNRPYSPLSLNTSNFLNQFIPSSSMQMSSSPEIISPVATQISTHLADQVTTEFSNMQNSHNISILSSDMSAFKPVSKQVLYQLQHEKFNKSSNLPAVNTESSNFSSHMKSKEETVLSESMKVQPSSHKISSLNSPGISSVKLAQNYFEELDKSDSISSIAKTSKSGLHKPDSIPSYQIYFEQLPSQRGISPDKYRNPAGFHRAVTPTSDSQKKIKDKTEENKCSNMPKETSFINIPQLQPESTRKPTYHQLYQVPKDTPISMTFQPVIEDNFTRTSPSRSRPSTPSVINKPAPIVPHYQINLAAIEHLAPENHLYEPSSPEVSRSPTPKPRRRSPAPGPPPNPLKAQAPRLKETTPQRHSLLTQASSNLRKEHEIVQSDYESNMELAHKNGGNRKEQDYPLIFKEQQLSNMAFKTDNYLKGELNIKGDSAISQNYNQRQMELKNVSEFGRGEVA